MWKEYRKILVSVFTLAGAIAAIFVVPEFRTFAGLDSQSNSETSTTAITQAAQEIPSFNKSAQWHVNSSGQVVTDPHIGHPLYKQVLERNNPFPKGFDSIKPGVNLSIVSSVFPGGEIGTTGYRLGIENGPFMSVTFFFDFDDENQYDPKIEWIYFSFRDDNAYEQIKREALTAFPTSQLISKALGAKLEWRNINGYEVTIEKSYGYSISPAE